MTVFGTRLIVAALALMAAVFDPIPAAAMDLEQAKAAGMVGERADGLLGVVSGTSAQAKALVDHINAERLKQYRAIADQNGTSVQAVQGVAGQRLIGRAAPGTYVNPGDGWVRK